MQNSSKIDYFIPILSCLMNIHTLKMYYNYKKKKKYILLDVLLCSIAEYFYELCRILASP